MIKLPGGWTAHIREANWDDFLQRDQLVSTREITYGESMTTRLEVVPAEVYQYEIWLVCDQVISPEGIAIEDLTGSDKVKKEKTSNRYMQGRFFQFLGKQSPRFVMKLSDKVRELNPIFVGDEAEGNEDEES